MTSEPERLSTALVKRVAKEEGITLLEARGLIRWRLRNHETNQSREVWEERCQHQEDLEKQERLKVKQQQNELRETLGLPILP